jgi:hypothetical protein
MPADLPRIQTPTTASSAELARIPAPVRQAMLFSARLALAEPLAVIGARVDGILRQDVSDSEARRDIRAALAAAGYEPPEGAAGGLRDHTSRRRLDLILEQNVRGARNYAAYAEGMDEDVLDAFPAQELVRIRASRVERPWTARWREAGGRIFGGRMIALKTSPVWASISRFGTPWPPFDFNSGMGVLDVSREEAERLGAIPQGLKLRPDVPPFAAPERAAFDAATPEGIRDAILKVFGEGAAFSQDGVLTLRPQPPAGTAGAGSLGDSSVHAAPPADIPREEALWMVESGQAAMRTPGGSVARITPATLEHWEKKGYTQQAIDARLARIRHAFSALQAPQEVWERNGKSFYAREYARSPEGKRSRMVVVVGRDGEVETWIPTGSNPGYFNKQRAGSLEYREGAQ